MLAPLLAVAYWGPFFLYAGFQTNLLALPIALAYARAAVEGRYWQASILALILGLWHPWTLLYYTASLALAQLVLGRSPRRTLETVAYAAPGLAAYGLVALAASHAGLAWRLAELVSGNRPLLWSLRIYLWGTGMRGDVLLPLALLEGPVGPAWLVAAALPAFAAVFFPGTIYLLRMLIEAPAPLLLHSKLRGKPWWATLLVAGAVVATWLFLLSAARPVA